MQVSHQEQVNAIKEANATAMQNADATAEGTVHEDNGSNANKSTAPVPAEGRQGEFEPTGKETRRKARS